MKGSYLLILKNNKEQEIKVGALGKRRFLPGYYLYVGSALNNLEKRIERHKRKRKKKFWHIDYLTTRFKFLGSVKFPSERKKECQIAGILKKDFLAIDGFGATDCACLAHLFYSLTEPASSFVNAIGKRLKNPPLTNGQFQVLFRKKL